MHQRINGRRNKKSLVSRVLGSRKDLHQAVLDISPPEKLLGRTDDGQKQRCNRHRREPRLHRIDGIYLRTGKIKEPRRGLVSHPEDAPEKQRPCNARQHLQQRSLHLWKPSGRKSQGQSRQDEGGCRHGQPEIGDPGRPWTEHIEPQQCRDADGRNQAFFHNKPARKSPIDNRPENTSCNSADPWSSPFIASSPCWSKADACL